MDLISSVTEVFKKRSQSKRLRIQQTKSLPYLYCCLSLGLSSGLNIERSLRALGNFSPEVFSQPIKRTIDEMDYGNSFPNATKHMSEIEPLRALTHLLLETYDLGNDSLWLIDNLTKDALGTIRRETDQAIKRLPITMLFPLVACILPAFICLSVLPTLINGIMSMNW